MTEHHDITDADIAGVVDDAVRLIALLRERSEVTNACRELDAIATLTMHARSRIPGLVTDARDEANTWAEIASALRISRPRVLARYALHAHNRRQPLALD